jgi:2-oxo-4-hydroxy-4-carboxy--5-ureidoimidazoline (OHCU) decarboxylase/DNA-directed RNA polymerase subunit RPC12/RpoP
MSRKETIQISCPNCGHRFQYDVWTFINADTEPYLKTALVTGLLNFTRCPKCSYEYFLALPLVYHEARAQRLWCHIPVEMGNAAERETLALSMVEASRLELNATLQTLGQALTPMQTEPFFSYLESPRIFDDINEMIEELRQVEHLRRSPNPNNRDFGPDSEDGFNNPPTPFGKGDVNHVGDKSDATAQLLEALEALQNVDTDKKFLAVLEAHSIFASPGTPAHLRGLSELAQARGEDEKAEYFNNLAGMLEQATGHHANADALIDALAAIAGVNSTEEWDAVFLAHPILSKPESIGQLRHAAVEVDDENTAQFYNDVADMLEERQNTELPPNLNEALQAFVEADSNEEHIAVITLHPVLHSPEAIAYFRRRAAMAYQAEEEGVAEFWENLAEMMERIRRVEMDEDVTSPLSEINEDKNKS